MSGAADLAALADAVREAERHLARAVTLAGRLAGSGASERVEGLPLEHFLGLVARLTGADRRMIVAAGEVLADLGNVAQLFTAGDISWGQVRAIVHAAKRLRLADRARLDARIAVTVAEHGGIDAFDPDQLIWAVDAAVEDLRDARSLERAEARHAESNFVAVQAAFDGRLRIFAELDAVAGAPVLNAFDAAAGRCTVADRDGTPDEPSRRARQYGKALPAICADWLAGDGNRPARPSLVAHVDLSQTSTRPRGTVELGVRGPLTRITAAALEALATDADLRVVLFDGGRPLAVSKKVDAATIPTDTRLAVRARDLGCRFPGSADPLAHCDLHHIVERRRGGDHDPDNLVALSRRHHTLIHRHGWALAVEPASGQVTARRGRRRWRSLPRGTPLARPPEQRGPPVQRDRPSDP